MHSIWLRQAGQRCLSRGFLWLNVTDRFLEWAIWFIFFHIAPITKTIALNGVCLIVRQWSGLYYICLWLSSDYFTIHLLTPSIANMSRLGHWQLRPISCLTHRPIFTFIFCGYVKTLKNIIRNVENDWSSAFEDAGRCGSWLPLLVIGLRNLIGFLISLGTIEDRRRYDILVNHSIVQIGRTANLQRVLSNLCCSRIYSHWVPHCLHAIKRPLRFVI